jgi:maltooligosyltrehalose trehalohydrolase
MNLVLFDDRGQRSTHPMRADDQRVFTASRGGIVEGQRYSFSLDEGPDLPDPASRWQPDGVHAPSAVWDPNRSAWTDADWTGIKREDLVIYELHVGAFTDEGTFAAIVPRLASLRTLGITAIELMPVGQFPGTRNWGYDGVYWFAVQDSYGGPRELQTLIDQCHAAGIAVILDVVYNHLGPEGNYLGRFGPYLTDHHRTPWGSAINYDDRDSDFVRDFVLQNVRQWVRHFHVDGLRLDAVQAIVDAGPRHILADIKSAAEDEGTKRGWPAYVIAESALNDVRLLHKQEAGGHGLDAQWSDDFHHSVHALLTGERDGYYADFQSPAALVKALNDTFVLDGCYSSFLGRRHGGRADNLPGDRFVVSIQTHDQVGNRALGDRLSTTLQPAQLRLAASLLLLSPHLPLLFMGEEYGETRPFPFFCDFGDPLFQEATRRGRREEFAGFTWGEIPDPQCEATFRSAKLTWAWSEGSWNAGLYHLYMDLLLARRTWPALRDYRHRTAQTVSSKTGATLLRLTRGHPEQPAHQIHACFNLTSMVAALPADWSRNRSVLLTTAATRYGGSATTPTATGALAPFECRVLRLNEENR